MEIFPDRELENCESYSMNLVALVPEEQEAQIDFVKKAVEELTELFRQSGVEIEFAVRTENNVSHGLVRRMKRFPLEHLSLRSEDHPLPSEFEE